MKLYYYQLRYGDRRILVSEHEIVNIYPDQGYYKLVATSGFTFEVKSSVPDEVGFDTPKPLDPSKYWFDRYL